MTIDEREIFSLKYSLGAYLLVSSASLAVADVKDPAFMVGLLNLLIALTGIIATSYTENRCGAIIGGVTGIITTFFNFLVVNRDIEAINQINLPMYLQDEDSAHYYLNRAYYPFIITLIFHILLSIECGFVTILVLWRALRGRENIEREKVVEYV